MAVGNGCSSATGQIQIALGAGTYYAVGELPNTQSNYVSVYIHYLGGSPPLGAGIGQPIDAGTLSLCGNVYADTKNNDPRNCFGDNLNQNTDQPSDDVTYRFTLTANARVYISTCGSTTASGAVLDTYVHLLDSQGNEIASNDNNGPSCNGTAASLLWPTASTNYLAPGTYYAVVEGAGTSYGTITTQLSAGQVGATPVSVSASTTTLDAGDAATLTASGSCYYSWSPATGLNTAYGAIVIAQPPVTTTYTVTGSSQYGRSTASVTITVRQNLNYVTTNTVLIPGKLTASDVTSMTNFDGTAGNAATANAVRQQQTTYFDGLGRPIQQVQVQASTSQQDIVTPITYDALGRTPITYLPYTGSTATGVGTNGLYQADGIGQQAAFYQRDYQAPHVPDRIANDAAPIVETVYEASPLNRVLQQGAPGAAWQPSTGHGTKFQQRANTSADAVRQWSYDFSTKTYAAPNTYAVGQLMVKESRDEQDQLVTEYTDKQGHLVLKRVSLTQAIAAGDLLTCYVYDDLDNLRLVISPEGYNTLLSNGSWNFTTADAFVRSWCFQYDYDGRHRLLSKQTPGTDPVLLTYNLRNQIVLTQDGNQRGSQQWAYTKYDALSRPIMTGYVQLPGETQSSIQTALDKETVLSETVNNSSSIGYSLTSAYPRWTGYSHSTLGANSVYTVTYYDTYTSPPLVATGSLGCTLPAGQWLTSVRGLVTGTSARTMEALGSGDLLTTATYYDKYYQPVQTLAQNQLGGTTSQTMAYDFAGKLLTSTTQVTQASTALIGYKDTKRFTYEAGGRPEATYQKTFYQDAANNFIGQDELLLVKKSYNEIGQLIAKRLHSVDGTNFLQKVDYRYNIRGWLTQINDRGLTNGATIEDDESDPDTQADPDLFALELRYNTPLQSTVTPQYNGNIAQAMWRTRSSNTNNNMVLRDYEYSYDAVNRIKSAQYNTWVGNGWGTAPTTDFSVAGITYDGNGNLLSMLRQGTINGDNNNPINGPLDKLKYTYSATINGKLIAGNQLLAVDDAVPTTPTKHDFEDNGNNFQNSNQPEYTYDPNGNLLSDANKGISNIIYTPLNQPSVVQVTPTAAGMPAGTNSQIQYTYSATGTKLRKKVLTVGGPATIMDYVGPVVYVTAPGANPVPVFAQTSEGRVLYLPTDNAPLPWKYEYHLKDHLGNLRFAFRADKDNGTVTQVVAGMEPVNAAKEERQFTHVAETRLADPDHARTGDYVARLNARTGQRQGPSIRFKVAAGDSLRAEVYARYDRESGATTLLRKGALVVGGTIISLPSQTGTDQTQPVATRRHWLPFVGASLALVPQLLKVKRAELPTAYLRYELFNKDSQLVATHIQALRRTASDEWQHLQAGTKADSAGFVHVSLVNESGTAAYFDDITLSRVAPTTYQENHYDPFGLNLVGIEQAGSPDSNFQYNGKEKQEDFGLNWTDYSARMYDAQLGRWCSVDPLADRMRRFSTYSYAFDNPIRFIDPDGQEGKDVILRGYQAQQAFVQLQASVQGQLKLTFDEKSGKVTYTSVQGANLSTGATQLASAIDDHDVTVNALATGNQTNSKGGVLVGGSFMSTTATKRINKDGTIGPNQAQTRQELNVPSLTAMDAYVGKPGATTLHEIVESYLAGKFSKETGISSGPGGTFPSFYSDAHYGAPPQSAIVNQVGFDQFSHEVYFNKETQQFEPFPGQILMGVKYTAQDNTHPPSTFMIFSK